MLEAQREVCCASSSYSYLIRLPSEGAMKCLGGSVIVGQHLETGIVCTCT